MAQCTGCGMRVNAENRLELALDRHEPWPFPSSILLKNGLRCDPDTLFPWVPPDQFIATAEARGTARVAIPDDDETVTLTGLSLEMVASPAHSNVLFVVSLHGGFQGYRMGSGNFWGLQRHITTYDNDAPVTFSGWEDLGGCENNAGPSLGSGGTVETLVAAAVRPGGTRFKVVADYHVLIHTFTSSSVNAFSWRPPRLQVTQWSLAS